MSENKQEGNRPETKFKAGGVTATIWKNEHEKNGQKIETLSMTLERSYKNKDDEWKTTNSYSAGDLIKIQAVLNKAIEYMCIWKQD